MQNDEMIWQVINHQFCSYKRTIGKAKSDKTTFCQHPYSVTGLCNRTSCPLANSLYATLREENGKVFLCMKTVERAHSPKNLWEKVLLSRNYAKAITQIEEHLQFFPKALMHRNKQRLTKIHQYLLRMRKIKLKELSGRKAKIVQAPTRKIAQRESRREQKALVAAKITNKIEQELVERLANGTYGDIYNFEQTTFNKALGQTENGEEEVETEESEEEDSVTEYVEDLESDEEDSMEEDMEDFEYLGDGQWGKAEDEDSDSSDDDDDDDDEESSHNDDDEDDDDDSQNDDKKDEKPKKKKKKKSTKKGSRVEIEYEEENELEDEQMQEAGMAW